MLKASFQKITCCCLVLCAPLIPPAESLAVVINAPPTVIGDTFFLRDGNILNVQEGGIVGRDFNALSGSLVNVSGGSIGQRFDAFAGSEVNISGGAIGKDFRAHSGSDVRLLGGEFRLNGVSFTDSSITLSDGDVFTGTLSDGSGFIFGFQNNEEGIRIGDLLSGVTLTESLLPTADLSPMLINSPVTTGPLGLRSGQTLTVQSGGQLRGNFAVVDANLTVEGGTVGGGVDVAGSTVNIAGGELLSNFRAYAGSTVNVTGGTIGSQFEALSGSEINITGGDVRSQFRAYSGSEVNVSGGNIGLLFQANSGSEVNISGGNVGPRFNANAGSLVNVSGGTIGGSFAANDGSVVNISGGNVGLGLNAYDGSVVHVSGGVIGGFSAFDGSGVELIGGEFRLNGEHYADDHISLSRGDLFTGTLADGSTFIFGSSLRNASLTSSVLPTLDLTPRFVNSPDNRISGLRAGQTLTVQTGGQLQDNIVAVDSTLNVEGGSLGNRVTVTGGTMNLASGTVGFQLVGLQGSTLNISGGDVGSNLSASSGTEVNISGGNVGSFFRTDYGSVVNISGGNIDRDAGFAGKVNISGGNFGENFSVLGAGSFSNHGPNMVNISGGDFGENFLISGDSDVRISGGTFGRDFKDLSKNGVKLVGGEFRLNGLPFTENAVTLSRGDVLAGTLADGSTFVFHHQPRSFIQFTEGEIIPLANISRTQLPPLDLNPMVIDGSGITKDSGLRPGQTLSVLFGGHVRNNFAAIDATLNVAGGSVGDFLEVVGGAVNISGGTVGHGTEYHGSKVRIADGNIGRFSAFSGSDVHISGGVVRAVGAWPGSEVRISGGIVGAVDAFSGSDVQLIGGEFRLNGDAFDGSEITLGPEDYFTGTLADGSAFIFSELARDDLVDVTLTRSPLPLIDRTPILVNSPIASTGAGLRAGQTLTLQTGGLLHDGFAVVDATLNVESGEVGDFFNVAGGTVNISGGTVGEEFGVFSGSTVNISGGTIGRSLSAHAGSHVNFFVTEFMIDDELVVDLEPGKPLTIDSRRATLSGILSDGSTFSFMLRPSQSYFSAHFIAPDATLTVTLVPEPASLTLLVLGCCPLMWRGTRPALA